LARPGDPKVEPIGALTASNVSEAVRGALEAKGLRVIGEDGKPVCEVWFRKEIPTAKAEIPGANFGQIPEGTLVGVINFPSGAGDFRGQGIKAGYYTLRYALILEDGNHLGVSPARDFFLLGAAAEDKDPNAQLKPEEMIKLSRAAAGTGHPSPWCLVPATSRDGLPKIVKNEHEHVILETKLKTRSGELPIGLIVVGKTEG
jgi:hypothetical protein